MEVSKIGIMDIFYNISKIIDERRSQPNNIDTSEFGGRWVNKGTDKDEKWEWVEDKKVKNLRTYYVNVFNIELDYIITVGYNSIPSAIESVDCERPKDVKRVIRMLESYYGTIGNVVINSDIGDDILDDAL